MLLVVVCDNFRITYHDIFQVGPIYYLTSLGLAWDAMMLTSQLKLDLMAGVELLKVIERRKEAAM